MQSDPASTTDLDAEIADLIRLRDHYIFGEGDGRYLEEAFERAVVVIERLKGVAKMSESETTAPRSIVDIGIRINHIVKAIRLDINTGTPSPEDLILRRIGGIEDLADQLLAMADEIARHQESPELGYPQTTARFRLESYPTNPRRPSAIWDFSTRDGDWWRLVADFSRSRATMQEAEIMCAALNRSLIESMEQDCA